MAATYLSGVPTILHIKKAFGLARTMDVGFAERREAAQTTRLEQFKKMQARLASPEAEARMAEHRTLVEARNKRLAEKEEIRRQEEARLAAIRAEEEAKRAAARRAKEEEERRRLEAEEAEKQRKIEAEKARLAASSSARAARALADVMSARPRRGGGSDQLQERRQA